MADNKYTFKIIIEGEMNAKNEIEAKNLIVRHASVFQDTKINIDIKEKERTDYIG